MSFSSRLSVFSHQDGDWCRMGDYRDMGFKGYLNLNREWEWEWEWEWKDDVINKLPSDPFEMNISGGCTMIRGWIQEVEEDIGYIKISEKSTGEEINVDDRNGFFLFDEKSKKALHPVNKHGDCGVVDDGDVSAPHDALFLALGHLGLRDLLSVEKQNLVLKELNVVGCNGLSMEGLLNNIKSFEGGGIKRLRIGGLHSITMEQFQELNKLLSLNNLNKPISPKPRFFHGGQLYLSLDDNSPIDMEACPKCHQLRQVYDCPAASCERKHSNCRACTFCIPRCTSCGCCFNERDYIETFCLDLLCLDCLTQILRFPDGEDTDISIPGFHQHQHQQASYHFCLYG